jgi:two-component system, NtrC family, sensor kinase
LVRIADNGSGIPPEIQQRIFETFFTTKPVGKGTGLGMAISHQIVVEKHGGKLNLKSSLDSGTEFEILLPLNLPSSSNRSPEPSMTPDAVQV